MSDSKPTIQIDSDWKRQAQEEKQRLAEEERKKSATSGPATPRATDDEPSRARREPPPASFETLVQSIATQASYYLGELAPAGSQPTVSLEMARHHIDTLAVLEAKTRGNLAPDEQRLLDLTLYELRMRFVSVAQQFIR